MLKVEFKPTAIDWGHWKSWGNKIVLFSGGKDSTVTLHLVKSHYDDTKALFVHTTCAVPGLAKHVKQVCKLLNVPLDIIAPKVSFFKLLEKWGAPTIRRRWCMRVLKQEPVHDYLQKIGKRETILFDGRRACESWMRKRHFERRIEYGYPDPSVNLHPKFRVFCISPIWNWTDYEVNEYIRKHKLPINPIYAKLGSGGDCICPVYKHRDFFMRLRLHYPKLFEKIVSIEKSFIKGGKYCVEFYLQDLQKQKLLTEFLE